MEGLAVAERRWVPLATEMVACGSGWGQRRLWECLLIAPVCLGDLEIRPLVENDSE